MFEILDLFSGIGGFSLGLERTGGFRTVAFCEIEPYPRAVLARHWPEVPCYDDVRTLTAERLRSDGVVPNIICGGFPCQDISIAGHGAGLDGERSGLWFEYARLVGELRPRYVIVENVSTLLARGLDRVLGSLAEIGYDAEWHAITANAIGAPHRRDRLWIIAYPSLCAFNASTSQERAAGMADSDGTSWIGGGQRSSEGFEKTTAREISNTEYDGYSIFNDDSSSSSSENRKQTSRSFNAERSTKNVAHPDSSRWRALGADQMEGTSADSVVAGGATGKIFDTRRYSSSRFGSSLREACERGRWLPEPNVCRVVDGVSTFMDCVDGIPIEGSPDARQAPRIAKVHRLKGLGNAVVPQIPEAIGNAILEWHRDND